MDRESRDARTSGAPPLVGNGDANANSKASAAAATSAAAVAASSPASGSARLLHRVAGAFEALSASHSDALGADTPLGPFIDACASLQPVGAALPPPAAKRAWRNGLWWCRCPQSSSRRPFLHPYFIPSFPPLSSVLMALAPFCPCSALLLPRPRLLVCRRRLCRQAPGPRVDTTTFSLVAAAQQPESLRRRCPASCPESSCSGASHSPVGRGLMRC